MLEIFSRLILTNNVVRHHLPPELASLLERLGGLDFERCPFIGLVVSAYPGVTSCVKLDSLVKTPRPPGAMGG